MIAAIGTAAWPPATAAVASVMSEQTVHADVTISADPSINATLNQPGEEAYTIVIGNDGPGVAHRLRVDFTPKNIEILSLPGSCSAFPCLLPVPIASGVNASVFVHFRQAADGPYGFTATVRATEPDPDAHNNVVSIEETPPGTADKTPPPPPPLVPFQPPPPPPPPPHPWWRTPDAQAGAAGLIAILAVAGFVVRLRRRWQRAWWMARLTAEAAVNRGAAYGASPVTLAAPALTIAARCIIGRRRANGPIPVLDVGHYS